MMKCIGRAAVVTGVALLAAVCAETLEKQPWQTPYVGVDATGLSVMGFWTFEADAPGADASEQGRMLTLRGRSRVVEEGKFGACIECFSSGQGNDVAEGVATSYKPGGLTPAGPFTLEMWIKPKPELAEQQRAFLIDKKNYFYAKDLPRANCDYCLYTTRVGETQRTFTAYLGFGDVSAAFLSGQVALEPGQWYHIAFTYDGEGTGVFHLNGVPIGRSTHAGRGPVTAGGYPVVIGDRVGSVHGGFPGYIDDVRISSRVVPFFSGELRVELAGVGSRTVFQRMETQAGVKVAVQNDTGRSLTDVSARVEFGGRVHEHALRPLAPKGIASIDVPVDATVRPDRYPLKVLLAARSGERTYKVEEALDVVIAPRPLPEQMPVVMWNAGAVDLVKQIGFTHRTAWMGHFDSLVWREGTPTTAIDTMRLAGITRMLDEHLAAGVGVLPHVYPGRHMIRKQRLPQLDRSGETYHRVGPCCARPEAQQYARNVGASVAQALGEHPGWRGSLIDSETRGHTSPCFCAHCAEAYRRFSGKSIPDEVMTGSGVHYSTLPDFPRARVVPEDHPILTYYRWFWSQGDGWNELRTQVDRGLASQGRNDTWTFHDPAVRVPSVWGSGGEVDYLSQWTYVYPDPLNIGQTTDELFAMAQGRPGQQVMKMTQIIWYRSQTAPKLPENEAERAQWERDIPDARFITIPPTPLREALWLKLSRPVRGIMYHGWGSLVPGVQSSYRHTNPESRQVLSNLIQDVVRPLGPTLLQIPDRQADVALLESFTAQVFTGGQRATRGWGRGWVADAHLVLQWAQLQPRIVYDETILRDGLDGVRVLVMPGCDVLSDGVVKVVHEFQARGGLVVADEHLAAAMIPDILLRSYTRTKTADADKAALQALSTQLRQDLGPFYQGYGDSDDADVVIRFRRYRNADYLFAVNDKRTYGNYVGHHGLVMEKGLPNAATLFVRRASGTVYDLTERQAVGASRSPGGMQFRAAFGPGQGRLYMITERPIAGVRIQVPEQVRCGEQSRLAVTVEDDTGGPIAAVVPVQIEILDPSGRPAEFSGYYGAKDGRVGITLDLAPNDAVGEWTIRATELASGVRRESSMTLIRP